MMTTMAALVGTLPIALGIGAGAKSASRSARRGRRPDAVAVADPLPHPGHLPTSTASPKSGDPVAREMAANPVIRVVQCAV